MKGGRAGRRDGGVDAESRRPARRCPARRSRGCRPPRFARKGGATFSRRRRALTRAPTTKPPASRRQKPARRAGEDGQAPRPAPPAPAGRRRQPEEGAPFIMPAPPRAESDSPRAIHAQRLRRASARCRRKSFRTAENSASAAVSCRARERCYRSMSLVVSVLRLGEGRRAAAARAAASGRSVGSPLRGGGSLLTWPIRHFSICGGR